MDVHIRWMIRSDFDEVMAIEKSSFRCPWSEDEFISRLRPRNCIARLAEDEESRVVGYIVYELHKNHIEITNLAVCPTARGQGVGTAMFNKIRGDIGSRRHRITIRISEENLEGQLFFKSMGMQATCVLRDYFDSPPADAYLMEYKMPQGVEV